MRSGCYISLIAFALISCAQSSKSNADPAQDRLEAFAAVYGIDFKTPPDNTEAIIHDVRVRLPSDTLSGLWFYTQLNTGEDRKLYRQRLTHIVYDAGQDVFVQKTYVLKDPAAFENAWLNPDTLSSVTEADFEPLSNSGCLLVWTHQETDAVQSWSGYVDPKTCIIKSKRRDTDIRIESESYLSKDLYKTSERGFDQDMNYLWGSKPGEMITLYPASLK